MIIDIISESIVRWLYFAVWLCALFPLSELLQRVVKQESDVVSSSSSSSSSSKPSAHRAHEALLRVGQRHTNNQNKGPCLMHAWIGAARKSMCTMVFCVFFLHCRATETPMVWHHFVICTNQNFQIGKTRFSLTLRCICAATKSHGKM